MSWYDFLTPKPPEPFEMVLEVPAHKVHLVSDINKFKHFKPRAKKAKGYFIKQGKDGISHIWILIKRKKGKIVPKDGYRIYGHESWHMLDFIDITEVISDPDKIYVPET